MILADANCSNMNTLLTGCFSNSSQHDYQKPAKAGLHAGTLRKPGFSAAMRQALFPGLSGR
jgi:hypothetical protein